MISAAHTDSRSNAYAVDTSQNFRGVGSPGLAKAVLDFATGDEQVLSAHRGALFGLFIDRVFGSRDPLPPTTLAAYRALAAAVTESELGERLLPSVVRLSKRSPETVLNSAAAIFGMLRLDLSQHAEALVRELLPLLRHTRETVRCGSEKAPVGFR